MSVSLPKVPGVTVSLPTISTVSSNVQQNLQNVNNIQPGQSLLTANRVQPGKYQSCNEGSSKNLGEGRWYWIHDFVATFGVNDRPILIA